MAENLHRIYVAIKEKPTVGLKWRKERQLFWSLSRQRIHAVKPEIALNSNAWFLFS